MVPRLGMDGDVIDSHLFSLLRIGGSEQRSIIAPARLKPRARLHNCYDRRAWRQFEDVHQKGVLGAEVGRRHRCVGGHVEAGARRPDRARFTFDKIGNRAGKHAGVTAILVNMDPNPCASPADAPRDH